MKAFLAMSEKAGRRNRQKCIYFVNEKKKFGSTVLLINSFKCTSVPRVQVKRRPSAAGFLPAPTQMALCLRLAYINF